ncbi:hypothetical protein GCM10022222_39900 [Amycolatopsis ultiminotia]|uniref:Uncharacterized protein n=1 Tax=Amycolatopsis ultiminotia TaxID=543629 RepID=A0ABP6WJ42_9PSEU
MSGPTYQAGPWPAALPPRRRRSVPAWLPAALLVVAGALTIVSTFLVLTSTTDRLLAEGSYFDAEAHTKVDVTTITAWSMTFSVPTKQAGHPLDGWGLVTAAAFAVLVAILLLAGRGRWTWTKPLATLASGLLIGAILMSAVGFAELLAVAHEDSDESVTVSAGPAIWLQIPAALLAIAAAVTALLPPRTDQPPPAFAAPFPGSYARAPGPPAPFPGTHTPPPGTPAPLPGTHAPPPPTGIRTPPSGTPPAPPGAPGAFPGA